VYSQCCRHGAAFRKQKQGAGERAWMWRLESCQTNVQVTPREVFTIFEDHIEEKHAWTMEAW